MFVKKIDTIAHYSFVDVVKDLAFFIRPYRGRFIIGSTFRLLSDIVSLYPAFAFASIVSFFANYQPGASLTQPLILLGLWLAASAMRSIGLFIGRAIMYRVAEKISIDAQLQSIRHMFSLDIAWHEQENTGNKLKRIQHGGEGLNKLLRIWVSNVIEIGVRFVGITIILIQFDLFFSVIVISFIITYLLISQFLLRRVATAVKNVDIQEEEMNGLMFEALNNIRTVKVLGMADSIYKILKKGFGDLFEKLIHRIFRFQGHNSLLAFWGMLYKVGTLMLIVFGVAEGHYEVGFLILFNGYFGDLWESVREFSNVSQEVVVARTAVGRMKQILREPIGIDLEKNKLYMREDWKKISVKNVSFSYRQRKVLDNISFDIQRGERIGIIGLSGAGKSTLFKLLLKEYEDYTGTIAFDNLPLTQISKKNYFKFASVVLQDTEVFNFSLKDNITLANPSRTRDARLLSRAVRTAHIDDFLERLPAGLDTIIGEKGVRLSGGERQRLGIARAIFKNPQILLLDEATSHLDIESEEKIRDSLHEFFQHVTAIVIAHRLTTVKEMDRIIVLEGGKIIEDGSFDALYAAKGRFFDLWEKQKL